MISPVLGIVVLVLAILVAIAAFGNGPLADALRSLIATFQSKAAKEIRKITSQYDYEIAKLNRSIAHNKDQRITVKHAIREAKSKLDEAIEEERKYALGAAKFAKDGNEAKAREAIQGRQAAANNIVAYQKAYDTRVATELKLETAITALQAQRQQLEAKKQDLSTRKATAQSQLEAYELLRQIQIAQPVEINFSAEEQDVIELENRAAATVEVVEEASSEKSLMQEIDEMLAGGSSVDDELNDLMTRHSGAVQRLSTSTPSEERVEGNGTGNPRVESRG